MKKYSIDRFEKKVLAMPKVHKTGESDTESEAFAYLRGERVQDMM